MSRRPLSEAQSPSSPRKTKPLAIRGEVRAALRATPYRKRKADEFLIFWVVTAVFGALLIANRLFL